jgi:hypothetical protein
LSVIGLICGTQVENLAIKYIDTHGERNFVSIKVSISRDSQDTDSGFVFSDFAGRILPDNDCKIVVFRNIGHYRVLSTDGNEVVIYEVYVEVDAFTVKEATGYLASGGEQTHGWWAP